jgi:hypothetical protein
MSSCATKQKRVTDGIVCFTAFTNPAMICGEAVIYRDGSDLIMTVNKESIIRPRPPTD